MWSYFVLDACAYLIYTLNFPLVGVSDSWFLFLHVDTGRCMSRALTTELITLITSIKMVISPVVSV